MNEVRVILPRWSRNSTPFARAVTLNERRPTNKPRGIDVLVYSPGEEVLYGQHQEKPDGRYAAV
jgi:hypothetical protein